MSFFTFLYHLLLSFLRTFNTAKSIFLTVLALLYFGFLAFLLYTTLPGILAMSNPNKDINEVFSAGILNYLCLEFVARYFSQTMPQLTIQPYLHLNISKNKLGHYSQLLSLGSFYNFLMPTVLIILGLQTLLFQGKVLVFLAWTLPPIVGVLCVHFMLIWTRTRLAKNWLNTILVLGLLLAFIALKYFEFIDLKPISIFLFFKNPLGLAVLVLLLGLLYFLTHKDQISGFYVIPKQESSKKITLFFDNIFKINDRQSINKLLIVNEIMLYYRNKRTRMMLIMQLVFIGLAYMQFFLMNREFKANAIQFLILSMLMSTMNYLQLAIKMDSRFFDRYMTLNLSLKEYLRSKFYFAYLLTIFFSLFLVGVAFIDLPLFSICITFAYFLVSMSSIAFIGIATMHKSGFDLNGGAVYFGGFSVKQILLNMLITLTPVLIFVPFIMLEWYYGGAIFFSICSLICFLLREQFIKEFVPKYQTEKYNLIESFRKIRE